MSPGWMVMLKILFLAIGSLGTIGMPYIILRQSHRTAGTVPCRRRAFQIASMECACVAAICEGMGGVFVFGHASDILAIVSAVGVLTSLALAGFAWEQTTEAPQRSSALHENAPGPTGPRPYTGSLPRALLSPEDRHRALLDLRRRTVRRACLTFVLVALTLLIVSPVVAPVLQLDLYRYMFTRVPFIMVSFVFLFLPIMGLWYVIKRARIQRR